MINNWMMIRVRPDRPAGLNLILHILSQYDLDVQVFKSLAGATYFRVADQPCRILPQLQEEFDRRPVFKVVDGPCLHCEGDEELEHDCPHKTYTSV